MRRAVLIGLLALLAACRAAPAPGIDEATPLQFERKVEAFRGKPVVVNYWATWCVPCTTEMPRIVDATERYEGRVAFLGVDVEDAPDAAERFQKRFGMTFESVADPAGRIRRAQRVLGLPVTQFYDADGDLALVHNGEITAAELREKIEELL
jgi:thiol-disulfide isomerase/thioredoxin